MCANLLYGARAPFILEFILYRIDAKSSKSLHLSNLVILARNCVVFSHCEQFFTLRNYPPFSSSVRATTGRTVSQCMCYGQNAYLVRTRPDQRVFGPDASRPRPLVPIHPTWYFLSWLCSDQGAWSKSVRHAGLPTHFSTWSKAKNNNLINVIYFAYISAWSIININYLFSQDNYLGNLDVKVR